MKKLVAGACCINFQRIEYLVFCAFKHNRNKRAELFISFLIVQNCTPVVTNDCTILHAMFCSRLPLEKSTYV